MSRKSKHVNTVNYEYVEPTSDEKKRIDNVFNQLLEQLLFASRPTIPVFQVYPPVIIESSPELTVQT